MMLMDSKGWVNRRVERVCFHDDRTAVRRVSLDYIVPGEAPRYRCGMGRTVRLVPLTIMRRKTLVNFGVEDMDGQPLSMITLRHNQALTEQMILVLAEITPNVSETSTHVLALAHDVSFGTQEEMFEAITRAKNGQSGPDAQALMNDPAAGNLIQRLANNFILLVTVDDNGPHRRIARYRFDEPLSLTYKRSGYNTDTKRYDRPGERLGPLSPSRFLAAIGWTPTIIRFPIPSAELARGYHFEVEAPAGVSIDCASLVAGRPNEASERPSWDHVAGGFPVVGLHALDVPNGSLSRAQVHLGVHRRGWLTASLLASLLSTVLLGATWWVSSGGTTGQVPSVTQNQVAAALLSIMAAILVFVAKPAEHQMASRLVTSVRRAAVISVVLLLGIGAVVLFSPGRWPWLVLVAAVAGAACSLLIGLAWKRAKPSTSSISPWEQGLGVADLAQPSSAGVSTLDEARSSFAIDRPAVKVESSEGDHREAFTWTEAVEEELLRRLCAPPPPPVVVPAPRSASRSTVKRRAANGRVWTVLRPPPARN
ncbi:hypothetical protein [Actinomycetospora chibensis]|uniref:Uncharacterized protein n=1 Tax=Actinomycetospora chibensis TaxID=663606 RepID=A0ABV9RN45_9PSEU|nr:hypothetical protein [Actinomycetospora chibensis]MDD7926983.1 hypothetical protein [Actinomycetospora chibensis]